MKNITQIDTGRIMLSLTDVLCESRDQESTVDHLFIILQGILDRLSRKEDTTNLIQQMQQFLVNDFPSLGKPFEEYRTYLLSGEKTGVDYYTKFDFEELMDYADGENLPFVGR